MLSYDSQFIIHSYLRPLFLYACRGKHLSLTRTCIHTSEVTSRDNVYTVLYGISVIEGRSINLSALAFSAIVSSLPIL